MANPLLCDPSEKGRLEVENATEQLNHIRWKVGLGQRDLRMTDVRELHRLAVDRVYPCGGAFRDARFTVEIEGGHVPPKAALVPGLVADAIMDANDQGVPAIERAARLLWAIGHIHPFAGGNGRTARALAIQLLVMDLGGFVPNLLLIPEAICMNRDKYLAALQWADQGDLRGLVQLAELMMAVLVGEDVR